MTTSIMYIDMEILKCMTKVKNNRKLRLLI